jgi:hypothetical protein
MLEKTMVFETAFEILETAEITLQIGGEKNDTPKTIT